MDLSDDQARRRFATSPRAILATVRPDGAPHLVPVVFALVGDTVLVPVDRKPKRTTRLQRLANVEHEPRCALLVDRYTDDWSRLWWVRADGRGRVVAPTEVEEAGRRALVERYPAYRREPPTGPYLCIDVERWRGWAAG